MFISPQTRRRLQQAGGIAVLVAALAACAGTAAPAAPAPAPAPPSQSQSSNNGDSADTGPGNGQGSNGTSAGQTLSGPTIIYNGDVLDCQLTFDLTDRCSPAQQRFFNDAMDTLPDFVNANFNQDLLKAGMSFEDITYMAMTACMPGTFEDFVATLYKDGNNNYAGLHVDRLRSFYGSAVRVYCAAE